MQTFYINLGLNEYTKNTVLENVRLPTKLCRSSFSRDDPSNYWLWQVSTLLKELKIQRRAKLKQKVAENRHRNRELKAQIEALKINCLEDDSE
jgi:hypothetical protein